MTTRRELLGLLAGIGVGGLGGCAGGGGPTTTPADDFEVTSSAFEDGTSIPTKYTADGADVSPPLSVAGLPEGTETVALILDDPDADGFVHWLLWNVPAETTRIPEGLPRTERLTELGGARQGINGFDELGYGGPAPPAGDGPHTYRFRVYAVEKDLSVAAGARRSALDSALDGSTLGSARLVGTYDR